MGHSLWKGCCSPSRSQRGRRARICPQQAPLRVWGNLHVNCWSGHSRQSPRWGAWCNFHASTLPCRCPRTLRKDPNGLFHGGLHHPTCHVGASVRSINEAACLIAVIQTLSISVGLGKASDLGVCQVRKTFHEESLLLSPQAA